MTTPMKSFSSAIQQNEPAPPLSFSVDGPWGHEEFEATRPSDATLMLFMALTTTDGVDPRKQLFELLHVYELTLGAEGFARIRKLVDERRIELEGLLEIFSWLMEQWADFPTRVSSASSSSPPTTGGRSTGRAPGKGSTQPASRSAVS